MTFARILCPIDFSETAARALSYALAFARWYGAHLDVVYVMDGSDADEPPTDEDALSRIGEHLPQAGGTPVTVSRLVEHGRPHRRIVRLALDRRSDLLVMGTHGRGGFNRLLLGSVTEKVVREAPCPVLTVPPMAPVKSDQDVRFERILCPTDFSPSAAKALRVALELQRQSGGTLTVLHAVEYMDPYTREYAESEGASSPPPELGRHLSHWTEQVRRRLHHELEKETDLPPGIEEVVVTNRAYKAVLQRAAAAGAQLIVMGAQGHDSLDLMLYGSTTQHVVRAAACPVLTVRAGGRTPDDEARLKGRRSAHVPHCF
jgi:nucleotide-binding universal stress UspA family protein